MCEYDEVILLKTHINMVIIKRLHANSKFRIGYKKVKIKNKGKETRR